LAPVDREDPSCGFLRSRPHLALSGGSIVHLHQTAQQLQPAASAISVWMPASHPTRRNTRQRSETTI